MDLSNSLAYATDITAYWLRAGGFDFPAQGRNADLGLADMGVVNLVLENADGRFTPKNTASPYFAAGRFEPYHHIKVKVTYNAVTYDTLTGVITKVKVDPRASAHVVYLQAADLMYVLSRTDIRCPLMTGYTGPIVNRLIDYAERGEQVTNPRFDDLQGLGGYTAMGSGILTRYTGGGLGAIMEGGASLKVTVAAANDGVRYTIPANLAGQKITVVAYVQADPNGQEADTYIQMQDSVGVVVTAANVTMKYGRWTRYSVTGTYNGGSTSQYIQVRQPAAGSFFIGATHATPFVSAIGRLVDEGQTILDNYSYPRGKALAAIQKVAENELGGLFYMDGSGNAVFEDKAHRWISPHTVSQATFDERGTPDYVESGDDRIKEVILDFPRYIEGAVTTLWQLDRVPVTLEASGSVTFEVDYGGGVGKNVILPVAGTDYTAVNAGGGSESANVLVLTWNDWGKGAEVTLENQQPYPVSLTALGVRGRPVRVASDRTPARATGASGPVIAAVLSHSYALNAREPSVQSWAQFLADRYDDQQSRIRLSLSASFPEAALTTDMTQILARKVSDRITFTNDNLDFSLKVNEDFYIDRITKRINPDSIEVDWDLVPTDPAGGGNFFTWDVSSWDGPDIFAP